MVDNAAVGHSYNNPQLDDSGPHDHTFVSDWDDNHPFLGGTVDGEVLCWTPGGGSATKTGLTQATWRTIVAGSGLSVVVSPTAITIASTSAVSGSGSANLLARWTGTSALGSSIIQDNAATVGVSAAPSARFLALVGGSFTGSGGDVAALNVSTTIAGPSGNQVYALWVNNPTLTVTGAPATNASLRVDAPANAQTGATNAATVYVSGAPTGAANNYALLVGAGSVSISTVVAGVWNGTTVAAGFGGTGIASYAIGDLLYASGATALSKLADVAAGSYLRSGGVATAPLWSTLVLANAATANRVVWSTATNTWDTAATLTFNGAALAIVNGAASFTVGDGTTAGACNVTVNTPANNAGNLNFQSAGASKWTLFRVATTFDLELDSNLLANVLHITNSATPQYAFGTAVNSRFLTLYAPPAYTATGGAFASGWSFQPNITGPSGQIVTAVDVSPGTLTAVGTPTDVISLTVQPMTVSGAVTNATTLKIIGAPSGGTNNYALWASAGQVRLDGNVSLFGAGSFGSGTGVLSVANAGVNPSTNPTGGGILYSDAGAGKWRGSGGTVTTFGPAEPHCPTCGRDFMHEWQNERLGYLAVCMWCLTAEIGDRPWIVRRD